MSITIGSLSFSLIDKTTNNTQSIVIKNTATTGDIIFKIGNTDNNTLLQLKNSEVSDNILHSIDGEGQKLMKNTCFKILSLSDVTAAGVTYTTTNIVNSVITRRCAGANRTDILPTASSIVASISNCAVGSSFTCLIRNVGSAHTVTWDNSGTNISLSDTPLIPFGKAIQWLFIVTNVGVPAITGFISNNVLLEAHPFNSMSVKDGVLNLTGLTTGFPMRRENNTGTGWTFSMYFRADSTIGGGDHDLLSAGLINLSYNRTNKRLSFKYGDNFNSLTKTTTDNSIVDDIWNQITLTLTAGDLGVDAVSINTYFDRMKIYINKVESTNTENHSNFGINPATNQFTSMSIGSNIGHIAWITIDDNARGQIGINNLYNNGNVFDVSGLGNSPEFWWQFENTDISPDVSPTSGVGDLVLASGTFVYNIYPGI